MAAILRHTAVWTGSPGLPGYSQFYSEVTGTLADSAQDGHNAVRGFFNELVTLIPDDITVTVDPLWQLVEVESGDILSEDAVGTPSSAVSGGYVSNWQRQVGALIEWTTGQFIDGRRLRGRTYVVPLGNAADSDGTLPTGTLAALAAASLYISDGTFPFVVWHRPKGAEAGSTARITGHVIRDKAAILRSRMN